MAREKETIRARASYNQIDAIVGFDKERLISDEATANLYLIVSPRSKKVWRWQSNGARKFRIGEWPAVALEQARAAAAECNALWSQKIDPMGERERLATVEADKAKAMEVEERIAQANSVLAVHRLYIATKAKRRTVSEKLRLVQKDFLDHHGDLPLRDLTKRMVIDRVMAIRARGSTGAADRFLSEVSTFLTWAAGHDYVEANVAASIPKQHEGEERRDLTLRELAAIYRLVEDFNADERDFFRLMILTGSRRIEAAGAKKSEYHAGEWTMPRERMKMKKAAVLPLGALGRAIFEDRSEQARNNLFHSKPEKDTFKRAILRMSELVEASTDWTWDDWDLYCIRHGVRTGLTRFKCCTKDIAELIINHAKGDNYDHGDYLDEKGAAMIAWEGVLREELARQGYDFPAVGAVEEMAEPA